MKKHISPPHLSTAFSESGKSAKRRFANILDTRTKRIGAAMVTVIVLAAILAGAFVFLPSRVEAAIDAAVSQALIEKNLSPEADFCAEGHIILGTDKSTDFEAGVEKIKVYTIASYENFVYKNGALTHESASGGIAAVVHLERSVDTNTIETVDVEYPKYEGEWLYDSIEAMFPFHIYLKYNPELYHEDLQKQIDAQASEYLASIGIGDAETIR